MLAVAPVVLAGCSNRSGGDAGTTAPTETTATIRTSTSAGLEPGDVVEGEIPCDVTPGLTVENLRVDYERDFDGGTVDVTWLSVSDA